MGKIEKELRFYDVNLENLVKKLRGYNFKVLDYRRAIFDLSGGSWLRLRTDGENTTVTVKKNLASGSVMSEALEHEVQVSSYQETLQILAFLGHAPRSIQHNLRMVSRINNSEICLDYWPQLKPILEIEAPDLKLAQELCKTLGLNIKNSTPKTVVELYEEIGIDVKKVNLLDFKERPILPKLLLG